MEETARQQQDNGDDSDDDQEDVHEFAFFLRERGPDCVGDVAPLFDIQLTPEVSMRAFLPGNLKRPAPVLRDLGPDIGHRSAARLDRAEVQMSDEVSDAGNGDRAEIDPRYDPAFQRGFSGDVRTAPRGESALRRTAAVNPPPQRLAQQQDLRASQFIENAPVASSVFAPEPLAAVPLVLATPAAVPEAAAPAASGPAATPRQLTRNPFTIALAALAVVLIVSGVVWAYESFATIVKNGGTRNEVEFWAAQTMSFGAPLAIVAGIAIATVLLVLFARSWHQSR